MSSSPIDLMIVVVAYRRDWNELKPIASLKQLQTATDGPRIEPRQVLIYENGDDPSLRKAAESYGFHYIADRSNGGTRPAYLACRALASRQELRWILLLDHDTVPTPHYFSALADAIDEESSMASRVGAIVPQVFDRGVMISPSRLRYAGRRTPQPTKSSAGRGTSAIASGSAFRDTAFDGIVPLPDHYWLDGLDHWMFWSLQRAGFVTRTLAARIDHSLSVGSIGSVPVGRYANIVASEVQLAKDTMPAIERSVFRLRMLLRAAALWRRRLPSHARIALAAAFRDVA